MGTSASAISEYLTAEQVAEHLPQGANGSPKERRDRLARAWKRAQRIRQDDGKPPLTRFLVGGRFYYARSAIAELLTSLSQK